MLGIRRDASDAEIRRAYHNALLRTHPDKGGQPEQFCEVQEAYDALKHEDEKTGEQDDGLLSTIARACREMWQKKLVRDLGVRIDVDVPLSEVYAGLTKRMDYYVRINGVQVKRSLLLPLTDFKQRIDYVGMGDQMCGIKGDLSVHIKVTDTGDWRIDDVTESLDLYVDVDVDLREFLFGGRVSIASPAGKAFTVEVPPMASKGGTCVVTTKDMGLLGACGARGDVIAICRLGQIRCNETGLCSACTERIASVYSSV